MSEVNDIIEKPPITGPVPANPPPTALESTIGDGDGTVDADAKASSGTGEFLTNGLQEPAHEGGGTWPKDPNPHRVRLSFWKNSPIKSLKSKPIKEQKICILADSEMVTNGSKTKFNHSIEALLPSEILFNIFLKLTVKSLIRCKSVCHSWRQFLCDPYFVRVHPSQNQSPKLVVNTFNSFYTVDYEETYGVAVPQNIPFTYPYHMEIACSCNGLVCLTIPQGKRQSQYKVVLWKPLTGDYNMLPNVNPLTDNWQRIGFGYDSSADDYKLVRIITREFIDAKQEFHESKCQVDLYSLNAHSWKNIQDHPDHNIVSFDMGLNFFTDFPYGVWLPNGYIYWEVHHNIVAFDLRKEKFRELTLPDEVEKECMKYLCGRRMPWHVLLGARAKV
ncbi:hypothetical protein LguiB_014032 [Lonicera macranthoides]